MLCLRFDGYHGHATALHKRELIAGTTFVMPSPCVFVFESYNTIEANTNLTMTAQWKFHWFEIILWRTTESLALQFDIHIIKQKTHNHLLVYNMKPLRALDVKSDRKKTENHCSIGRVSGKWSLVSVVRARKENFLCFFSRLESFRFC